jgi:hypothetical protein
MRFEITRWPKWLHEKVMQHPNMSKFGIESVLNTKPHTDHTITCVDELSETVDVNELVTACLNQVPEHASAVLLSDSVNEDGSVNSDLILVSHTGELLSEVKDSHLVIQTPIEDMGGEDVRQPQSPPDLVEEAPTMVKSNVVKETSPEEDPQKDQEEDQEEDPQKDQEEDPQKDQEEDQEENRPSPSDAQSQGEASQHVRFRVSQSISGDDKPDESDELPEWLRPILPPILPPSLPTSNPCPEMTKILYKDEQIELIHGLVTPRLLIALANQRVQLPGINGKVPCFMQGTKVRVGYNLIDPSTYSAATYTVSSRVSRPSSLASLRRGILHRGDVVKAHRQRRAASERR